METYKNWSSIPTTSEVLCLTHFNLNDKVLIAAGFANSELSVWDIDSKEEEKLFITLSSHFSAVNTLCPTKLDDKIHLLSGDESGYIHLYDLTHKDSLIKKINPHSGAIKCIVTVFLQNEEMVVSAGEDSKIKVYRAFLKEELVTLSGHQGIVKTLHVCSFNNTTYIISGGYDNMVNVWNPLNANCNLVMGLSGHDSWILCLTFTKLNGKEVIVSGGNDNKIKVWNPLFSEKLLKTWNPIGKENKKLLMTLYGHKDSVTSLATVRWSEFGKNKEFIMSGSNDGTIKIWDPSIDLKEICSITIGKGPVRCLTDYVLNNEVAIVSGGNTDIEVWKKEI